MMVAAFLSKSSLPSPSFSSLLFSLSLSLSSVLSPPPISTFLSTSPLFSPGNNVREQQTLRFAYKLIILIDREFTVFLCERSHLLQSFLSSFIVVLVWQLHKSAFIICCRGTCVSVSAVLYALYTHQLILSKKTRERCFLIATFCWKLIEFVEVKLTNISKLKKNISTWNCPHKYGC